MGQISGKRDQYSAAGVKCMDLNPLHCSKATPWSPVHGLCWQHQCPGGWGRDESRTGSCALGIPAAPGLLALPLVISMFVGSVRGTHSSAQDLLCVCAQPLAPMGSLSVPLGTPEWPHLHQSQLLGCGWHLQVALPTIPKSCCHARGSGAVLSR